MFDRLVDFVSNHVSQIVGVLVGLTLAGSCGYVVLSGTLADGLFGEMAWEKNVYENSQMFGAASYQVGEVDGSDNRIHEEDDDTEGMVDEATEPDTGVDQGTSQDSALAGGTMLTDNSTAVGSETTVNPDLDNPNGTGEGAGGNPGNGEGDDPSGPGDEGDNGGEGTGDNPSYTPPVLTPEQEAELDNKDDYKDDDGNRLVGLYAEMVNDGEWVYVAGDAFRPGDIRIIGIFVDESGNRFERVIEYSGTDSYTVSMSTGWNGGTHYATFSYGGLSTSVPYTIKRGAIWVNCGGSYLVNDDIRYSSVPLQDTNLPDKQMQAAISASYELDLSSLVGGAFVNLSDVQRQLITVLGDAGVQNAFDNGSSSEKQTWVVEERADGYLNTMVTGFCGVNGNNLRTDENGNAYAPCTYLPESYTVDTANQFTQVISMVEQVPDGFLVKREAGDASNNYRGDQVLVGYENQEWDGERVALEVPQGVTKIKLTKTNPNVRSLVIPESVLEIDFASLTEHFPNLERIDVGWDANSQSFGSINGETYSVDGTTLTYVPPRHENMDQGWNSWYYGVNTIATGAFAGCDMTSVTVPAPVTRLEKGCFADSKFAEADSGATLRFDSPMPIEGVAESGAAGNIYVPDASYNTACKNWAAGLADARSDLRVGVLGEGGTVIVEPGTYMLDKTGTVVVRAADKTVLAGVRFDAAGALSVPQGIETVEAGAFASSGMVQEILFPASLKNLGPESLVALEGVESITLAGDAVMDIDRDAFGEDGVPEGLTVFVPSKLYEDYLAAWGAALGLTETEAKALIKQADTEYVYLDGAKYQTLDGGALRLVEVYSDNRTFFEPAAGTTEIAEGAFDRSAALEIVHLPSSVTTVSAGAFAGCGNLESVLAEGASGTALDLPKGATLYRSTAGASYSYESATGALYEQRGGELTLVNVPTDTTELLVRAGTTCIGDGAFAGCAWLNEGLSLDSPETLRSIGARAFEGCTALGSADFTQCASLEAVGASAFAQCTNLYAIVLPSSVKTLGDGAFEGCAALQKFKATGLSELPVRTFRNCSALNDVYVPNVTRVGDECFYACVSLAYLDPSGGVAAQASDAAGAEITDLSAAFSDGYNNIGPLTWVGDNAFAQCAVFCQNPTQAFDMASLEHIGAGAFMGCNGLREVTLSESLTELGEESFRDCSYMQTLNMNSSVETVGRYSFYGCANLKNLNVSEHQQGVMTVLGACAFAECDALERIDLSSYTQLAYIGNRAFEGCDGLLRVTMPAHLTKVAKECFSGCTQLSIVELTSSSPTPLDAEVFGSSIPEYVRIWVPSQEAYEKYLAAYEQVLDAEYGEGTAQFVIEMRSETSETLRGITYTAEGDGWAITSALPNLHGDVVVASSVTRIADGAFEGCAGIESVTLEQGSSIELGDRAFAGCTGIQAVYLLGDVPMWGDGVFEGCTNLASARVGYNTSNDIPRIGTRAFADCASLSALRIYAPVAVFGEEMCKNCASLPSLAVGVLSSTGRPVLESSLERVEDGAFENCTTLNLPFGSRYAKLQSLGARVLQLRPTERAHAARVDDVDRRGVLRRVRQRDGGELLRRGRGVPEGLLQELPEAFAPRRHGHGLQRAQTYWRRCV